MTTVVLNTTTRKVEVFSSARDVQARAYGHDSQPALEAATVPAGIPLLFVRGYAVAGDGGAAHYKRVASEPSHFGKIQSSDGAWWELAETRPTPQMFGALADNSNDDLEAINRCGQFVNVKNLGLLYIPNGTYRVKDSATGAAAAPGIGFVGVVIYDGMTIRGQSREGTIIKSVDGFGRRLITARDEEASFDIENLTLDGNKATHTDGTQGIRLWSRNTRVGIRNVTSSNNGSYGFGVGWNELDIATNIELFVSDMLVENNATDGCDAKITKRAFLDRVIARNNGNAGIDIRGHYVVLSNCLASGNGLWGISSGRDTSDGTGIAHHQSINCISHNNTQTGFRFRDGAVNTSETIEFRVTNPLSYENATGAEVICGRGAITITGGAIYDNTTYGIYIRDTTDAGGFPDPTDIHVEVVGTTIRDNADHGIICESAFPARFSMVGGRIVTAATKRGISAGFSSVRCTGVRFEGGDQGINWNNTVGAAEDGEITGCVFDGQSSWGIAANDNSTGMVTGCTFRSGHGFRTTANALDWFLSNNDFSGVSGTRISDASGTVRSTSPFNGSFDIATDTAVTIEFTGTKSGLLAVWSDTNPGFPPAPNGILRFKVGSSPHMSEVALVDTTNISLTTGALTGTTGAAGNVTFSAHTDGKIYIENRSAFTRNVRYQVNYSE